VGLTELRFINDFKEEEIYPAIGTRGEFRDREIIKHSIYFLCETDEKKSNSGWNGNFQIQVALVFESERSPLFRKSEDAAGEGI